MFARLLYFRGNSLVILRCELDFTVTKKLKVGVRRNSSLSNVIESCLPSIALLIKIKIFI
jgi:hypothetical protein